MSRQIMLGQYLPGSSFLHLLDPRSKLIAAILLMVLILSSNSALALGALLVLLLLLVLLAQIKLSLLFKTVRPVLLLLLFAFLFNLFSGSGEIIFQASFIVIRMDGLINALKILARLSILIMTTSLLITLTTTPILVADAIESLLSPLKVFRFPVHEISMMMSIALRFVPTLLDEMQKIMKAQSSRGADYDTGNAFKRARGFVSILVPLFISAFRRADDLATAMEARCYRGGENRTRLKVMSYSLKDLYFAFLIILVTAAVFILPLAFPGY